MFVLYIRWLYIIIIHGYLTWILKFLSSLLDLHKKKKREKKNNKKLHTHTTFNRNTHEMNIYEKSKQKTKQLLLFLCATVILRSLSPLSLIVSLFCKTFFFIARACRNCCSHIHAAETSHTHTDTLTLMMAFNSFSLTVLQTICIVLQKNTSHPPHFYVIVCLIPSNHTHTHTHS